ncbi:hypothetical protein J6TS2_49380 [Heyndrickxia sporothermodurans]|nr:hypothetical protein J6TS2_49380 [Heyndrickxia sporothermodurans]
MNCPVCDNVRLREVEKEHVLIDICPSCKGVWLDRGELEKITQGLRDDHQYSNESYRQGDYDYQEKHHYSKGYDSKYDKYSYPPKHKKKKKMIDILGDLFD